MSVVPGQVTWTIGLDSLLEPEVLVFAVPIVGVLAVVTMRIVQEIIRHRERIEMIRQGINPDEKTDVDAAGNESVGVSRPTDRDRPRSSSDAKFV